MYRLFLPPANEVWGKVIFSVACVKNSVHEGWGVCLSACWDPPREKTPSLGPSTPGSRHPPGNRHPPAQCMLGDTVNKRAVCILLECNLVFNSIHQCTHHLIASYESNVKAEFKLSNKFTSNQM